MIHQRPKNKGRWNAADTILILFIFVLFMAVSPVYGDSPKKNDGQSGQIKIIITDLENDKGTVRIALFDSEDSYKSGNKPFKTTAAKIKNRCAECTFDGVPYKTYAIRLYHDQNGNGQLDKDARGIPMEPYAFSNNAKGFMGPAAWKDAKFTIRSNSVKMEISLD